MNVYGIIFISVCYLALLFLIAWWSERLAANGKRLFKPNIKYALSLTVYCTAWTYYGSVGKASLTGLDFLAIYIGPTIGALLFTPVLSKIVRICKSQNLTSIADMISARYGKKFSIAAVVTVFCVIGIIPYISLQLRAITDSIHVLAPSNGVAHLIDDSAIVTGILIIFIILFGARTLDPEEKNNGLISAIAFESLVKLFAFLIAGIFIVYVLFNGFNDIFQQSIHAGHEKLFSIATSSSYTNWAGLLVISTMAVFLLPRQFQVAVVENTNESQVKHASWMFPLYLLLINIFVFPIALAGLLMFKGGTVNADTFVLALPLASGNNILSLIVYLGGFSAATSMVIIETIALATMVSNNLVTPLFLKISNYKAVTDGRNSVLNIRRISIGVILVLAFVYNKTLAPELTLVSIGLTSFVAVAQFAPAVFLGIYWKKGSYQGALAGICVGFLVWAYTLVIPNLVQSGLLDSSWMNGIFGFEFLKPYALFGLKGLNAIVHAAFWSLLFNLFTYTLVSILSKQDAVEVYQREIFVDIFKHTEGSMDSSAWKGTAYLPDLKELLINFIPADRATNLLKNYATRHHIPDSNDKADPRLVRFVENILSGIIGAASARIMVSSVTKEEVLKIDEVLHILRESQQMITLNKELRKKSSELEKVSSQLKEANSQLMEMDAAKDEFLYTVTHELRTPVTSLRAMAEILHDHDDMTESERIHFLTGMIKETERVSHLITQVLNLERYGSGRQRLELNSVIFNQIIDEVIASVKPLMQEKHIEFSSAVPNSDYLIRCDENLIKQVLINLFSNAIKFVPATNGKIKLTLIPDTDEITIWIDDNGKGIEDDMKELVFDKFFQAKNQSLKKPQGSGLGLAICKNIVELHEGTIKVSNSDLGGARLIFTLPTNL